MCRVGSQEENRQVGEGRGLCARLQDSVCGISSARLNV